MERSSKHTTPDTPSAHGLVDLDPAQVEARLAEVGKYLDAIDALLLDAEGLNAAQRRRVSRLRGHGEAAALSGIFQFAAVHPELFRSLANHDDGNDAATFETTLLSNRLENSQALTKLAGRLAGMEARISSCALNAVGLCKPAALEAYGIVKLVAGRVAHSELVFPALDFYRAIGGSSARTKARQKAAAEASSPPVSPACATRASAT